METCIGGGGCLWLCLNSNRTDLPTFRLSLLAFSQFDTLRSSVLSVCSIFLLSVSDRKMVVSSANK